MRDFGRIPERLDYALVVPDKPCPGAGVFTTNRFCAAPVQVSRANLGGADKGYGIIAGVSINSGNANAATGETGLACARETCSIASQVISCEPQQILVASTGVIARFCRSTRLRLPFLLPTRHSLPTVAPMPLAPS